MKIEHIAIWTADLERLKSFYQRYFEAQAGEKYVNPKKGFESYFLSFESGCRIEIMYSPQVAAEKPGPPRLKGWAHLAFSTGSAASVDALIELMRKEGCPIASEPRRTGDGYYEGVVCDPDGNLVEITI